MLQDNKIASTWLYLCLFQTCVHSHDYLQHFCWKHACRAGADADALKQLLPVIECGTQRAEELAREGQNCPICLASFTPDDTLTSLQCNHLHHYQCLFEWLRLRSTCPMCKEHLPTAWCFRKMVQCHVQFAFFCILQHMQILSTVFEQYVLRVLSRKMIWVWQSLGETLTSLFLLLLTLVLTCRYNWKGRGKQTKWSARMESKRE
jgi:hypothetical protein